MINYMNSSSPSPPNCNHHVPRTAALPKGCCISRILRRILCFSSLPWCPFDHHHHHHHQQPKRLTEEHRLEEKTSYGLLLGGSSRATTATPGLVARLMGLESLPHEDPIDQVDTNSPADHSSNKSTSSSKVIPTYQELEEDDKFYILRFGSKAEDNKYCKKRARRRKGREGLEERANHNKENEGMMINLNTINVGPKDENWSNVVLRPLKNNSASQLKNPSLKKDQLQMKEGATKTESDYYSEENSSPNSVLEFLEFAAADQTTACSGDDISRRANSKMIRRTLSDELQNCGRPKERRLFREEENLKIHEQEWIGKLAAMDMTKSGWVQEEIFKNQQCAKEIGRDVASHVLDHLLDELTLQLYLHSSLFIFSY